METRRGPRGKSRGFPALNDPAELWELAKETKRVKRKRRAMMSSKTGKGKIEEKRCLNVSQKSSDMQAEKWPLVTEGFFKGNAWGEMGMEPDGSVLRRAGKAE